MEAEFTAEEVDLLTALIDKLGAEGSLDPFTLASQLKASVHGTSGQSPIPTQDVVDAIYAIRKIEETEEKRMRAWVANHCAWRAIGEHGFEMA